MYLATELQLCTPNDVYELSTFGSRFAVWFHDGLKVTESDIPLIDLSEAILNKEIRTIVLFDVRYEDADGDLMPTEFTVTIDPKHIVEMRMDASEVPVETT